MEGKVSCCKRCSAFENVLRESGRFGAHREQLCGLGGPYCSGVDENGGPALFTRTRLVEHGGDGLEWSVHLSEITPTDALDLEAKAKWFQPASGSGSMVVAYASYLLAPFRFTRVHPDPGWLLALCLGNDVGRKGGQGPLRGTLFFALVTTAGSFPCRHVEGTAHHSHLQTS